MTLFYDGDDDDDYFKSDELSILATIWRCRLAVAVPVSHHCQGKKHNGGFPFPYYV